MTPDQQFLDLAHAGRNVFLTGMAGTGKSYLLRQFIQECATGIRGGTITLGSCEPRRVDVTAPTGIAALNVGGMTVHRWSGMLLGPCAGQSNEAYARTLLRDGRPSLMAGRGRVKRAACLVIDEVSMLCGRQFEFLDYWMRTLRDDPAPFGGCQVIVIGDFMQLPPVRTSEREPYDWCFLSPAWARAEFQQVTLSKVHRQDEPSFIHALGNFRMGQFANGSGELLRGRVVNFPDSNITRLFTHNTQVDKWNTFKLDELAGPETVLEAETSGPETQLEFLTKNLLTPQTLRIKPGCRVMVTRNDSAGQFVNGTIGTVEDIEAEGILLSTNRGPVRVKQHTWTYDREDSSSATFKQFPLRLAYAVTIHKSQGATMDAAYVDIRAAREPGQAYVAISRVRSLRGLNLKEWPRGVWVSQEAMKFYGGAK